MENPEGKVKEVSKLFVRGISEITSETLGEYFSKFGQVKFCHVYKDIFTGMRRGFAFVGFSDSSVADKVVQESHIIDDIQVVVQRAIPKQDYLVQQQLKSTLHARKLFVGGLPHDITNEDFTEHFAKFGKIVDSKVIHHKECNQSRGFGFVTFDSEESAMMALCSRAGHQIKDNFVDVKPAIPKQVIAYNNYYYNHYNYYMGFDYRIPMFYNDWALTPYMAPPYYHMYPPFYPVSFNDRYHGRVSSNRPVTESSSSVKIPTEIPKESKENKNEEPEEITKIPMLLISPFKSELNKDMEAGAENRYSCN